MSNLIALPTGTELVGDYRIERVLGAGGFGITYLADEIALARAVTIKEYFPADFAARNASQEAVPRSHECRGDYSWGLDRFIEEAQTLARFDHPNIVRVYRYFRANNTGYMVLQWEEGKSLKTWLKELKRAPRQNELDEIITPLLEALEMVHKADYLHRDIAPDNIIVRRSGAPVLIDFGSARGEIAAHSKTVSALVKPGYSPYEQYAETSRQQGPWTDIYALGATLYHAVTGKRPPDAPSRMVHDEKVPVRDAALGAYRAGFLDAIDRALALDIRDRPQSVMEWRGQLLAPEPARTGWRGKAREKARAKDAAGDENGAEAPPAAAAGAIAMPLPDAPGPKGGLLDYLERLGSPQKAGRGGAGPGGGAAQTAVPETPAPAAAAHEAKPAAPAKTKGKRGNGRTAAAKPEAAAGPTPAAAANPVKAGADAKSAAKASEAKAAALPANVAIVPAAPRRLPRLLSRGGQPRPKPMRRGLRLRPLLVKLAIGVCVASAAVMLQSRLPQILNESRSASTTTASTTEALSPQLASIGAHSGGVTALIYSADGSRLHSTGGDATLKSWRTSGLGLIRTIPLDAGPATSLAVKGDLALTGHASGQIAAWDLASARKQASYQRNEADVWSLTFAGDRTRFLTATHDWKVTLWDEKQGSTPLHVFEGHDNSVQAIAYDAQGALFASGGADRTVKLWSMTTLDLVRTYRGARDFISSVAISPDGKLIAAASLDGSIRLWSTSSPRQRRRLAGHKGAIHQIAFAPDSRRLVSAGSDGTVRLWDTERRRAVRAYAGHQGEVKAAVFAPDGQHIASAGADGTIRIWRAQPAADNETSSN